MPIKMISTKTVNRNIFFYGGATGLAQVFSFLALFIYTSILRPELYAIVAIFETVLLLLQSFIGCAIDRSSQRFYLEYNPIKVISTSASIAIVSSILIYPLALFGTVFLNTVSFSEFSIIYVTALSYILHTIVLVKYQFSDKPKAYFMVSVAKTLIFLIASVFFLYILNLKELSFLYASSLQVYYYYHCLYG